MSKKRITVQQDYINNPERIIYKFQTPFNASMFPRKYERNLLPSLTIPDQTMSVAEIMRRYASGLGFDGVKVPLYDGEDYEFPNDFHKWDLADRQEYIEERKLELDAINKKLHEGRSKTELDKLREEVRKEIQEELRKQKESDKKAISDAEILD